MKRTCLWAITITDELKIGVTKMRHVSYKRQLKKNYLRMKERGSFSIKKRLKSFSYAFRGVVYLVKMEHNAQIHVVIALFVVSLGFLFHIDKYEWLSVIIAIGMVISAEAINTAIEKLSDYVSPNENRNIGKIKDVSAAAVLLIALTAMVIGLVIFVPYLLRLF